MPATAMFSNFKSRVGVGGTGPQNILDHNPITQYFEIGKQTASAGPELVWRIHDAYRKSDRKVSDSFVFILIKFLFVFFGVYKTRKTNVFNHVCQSICRVT
ncbi:hypothetical protein O3M35_002555 [Rhynocoris fuscipes]|uniref:Uncharacterized protein n=1 Tax=Rhynocoris fuscipes TaxID=488301 RepID=A0AAW1CLT5_9HEMI